MIILLMISIGVVAVLLVRLASLIRQIPRRNEDFDVFSVYADADSMAAAAVEERSGFSPVAYFRKLRGLFSPVRPTRQAWAFESRTKD